MIYIYLWLVILSQFVTTASNSTHSHGAATALGNITVGSSSNGVVFSVAERIGQIRIGGNTLGTSAVISSGTVLLAGEGIVSLSQNGNSISIIGSAATGGGGAGVWFTSGLLQLLVLNNYCDFRCWWVDY